MAKKGGDGQFDVLEILGVRVACGIPRGLAPDSLSPGKAGRHEQKGRIQAVRGRHKRCRRAQTPSGTVARHSEISGSALTGARSLVRALARVLSGGSTGAAHAGSEQGVLGIGTDRVFLFDRGVGKAIGTPAAFSFAKLGPGETGHGGVGNAVRVLTRRLRQYQRLEEAPVGAAPPEASTSRAY